MSYLHKICHNADYPRLSCVRSRLHDEVSVKGLARDKAIRGRPASPRPAGLGFLPITHLMIASRGQCKKIQCKRVFAGREPWERPGSPALTLLSPSLHRHDDKWVYVLQEVGFGLGAEYRTECGPVFPLCFGTQAFWF